MHLSQACFDYIAAAYRSRMSSTIGSGTLKCITWRSARHELAQLIAAALEGSVTADELRVLSPSTLVVFTALTAPDLRDLIAQHLREDESLLIAEFDRWSTYGDAIDTTWLLRRGH